MDERTRTTLCAVADTKTLAQIDRMILEVISFKAANGLMTGDDAVLLIEVTDELWRLESQAQ